MDNRTLERHAVLSGASAQAISEFAQAHVAQHRFQTDARSSDSAGYLYHATCARMGLTHLSFGAETLVDGFAPQSFYYIQVPLAGQLGVETGGQQVMVDARSIAIVNPFEPVKLYHNAHCRKVVVRLTRQTMEQHLAGLLGRPLRQPLEFAPKLVHTAPRFDSLLRSIELVCKELEDPYSAMRSAPVASALENMLVHMLVSSVQHSHSEQLQQEAELPGPLYLQKAERYMREHLAEEVQLADLVQVAATSERNLYKAFKNYRATTPMNYLKQLRLQAARQLLLAARAPTSTVAGIALQVGCSHLGNFAADYQRLFGELPSQTLKQTPPSG